MAGVVPYYDFIKANGSKARLPFLVAHPEPHLYFLNLPQMEMSEEEQKTLVVPPGIASEDAGQQAVVAVRNDSTANDLEVISFGRGKDCDMVVPEARVSKFHGYFERFDGGWHVTDNDSTNGISVDGEEIPAKKATPVRSGSKIILSGCIHILFLEPEDLFAKVQDAAGWLAPRP